MKKCLHCGKKGKLILVDECEDEKEYLCYKCNKKEKNKSKERAEHVKEIFNHQKGGRAIINIAGIGDFGHKIISLLNKSKIKGADTIKIADNKIEYYSKLVSKADILFLFSDISKKNLLIIKIIYEKAKASGSVICLCTSNLKKPAYDILKNSTHTIITVKSNKRTKQMYATFIKRLVENIALPSLVGLDYAEIKSIIRKGKIATISTGKSKGRNKAQKVAENVFSILNKKTTSSMCIMIYSGPDLTLDEINSIAEVGTEWATKNANVIWGAQIDDELKNKIELYCLINYSK